MVFPWNAAISSTLPPSQFACRIPGVFFSHEVRKLTGRHRNPLGIWWPHDAKKGSRKGAIFHINWSSGPRYCSRSVGTTFGRCCEGSIFKNTSEKLFQFLGKIERCFRCSPKSGQFMLKLESLNFRSITFGAGLFHVPCSIHSIVLYTDSIDVLCVSGWCFDGDHQQTKWTSIKQVDSRFLRRRCGWHFLTARCTLLETNTSPETPGLEDEFPFGKACCLVLS